MHLLSLPPPATTAVVGPYGVRSHLGSCVQLYSLAETPQSPLPPHLGSYTRALLVNQDRQHLLETPLFGSYLSSLTLSQHCIASEGLPVHMIGEVSWQPKRRRRITRCQKKVESFLCGSAWGSKNTEARSDLGARGIAYL